MNAGEHAELMNGIDSGGEGGLQNAVREVLNLHAPDPRFAPGWCMHCCVDLPCDTVRRIMREVPLDVWTVT